MGIAFFYHLTEATSEQTLAMLIPKAIEAGWRIEVRGTDPARMAQLDVDLWRGADDSFLPHGLAGGPHDALQPVLLTSGQAAANDPTCVMSVDGADIAAGEVATAARACILFDGGDDAATAHARTQWKTLTDAGCAAQYWAQDNGRWTKKAEK